MELQEKEEDKGESHKRTMIRKSTKIKDVRLRLQCIEEKTPLQFMFK